MITFLTKESRMSRAKSSYASKIQKLMQDDDKFTWDIIDGHSVDISPLMLEVVSICSSNEVQSNIASVLTSNDIIQFKKSYGTKVKHSRSIYDCDNNVIAEVLSPYFRGVKAALSSFMTTNQKIASYIVFEAVLIAQSNLALTEQYACMTFFSTMCCVINHWAIKKLNSSIFRGAYTKGVSLDIKWKGGKIDRELSNDAIDFLKQLHDQKALDVAIKFIRDIYSKGDQISSVSEAIINNLIPVTEHIKAESKKYEHLVKLINRIRGDVEQSFGKCSLIYRFIDKRHLNNCIYAISSTFCDLMGFGIMWHVQMLDSYAYLMYASGEKILNISNDQFKVYIEQIIDYKRCAESLSIKAFTDEFSSFEIERLLRSKSEVESINARLRDKEERCGNINRELKRVRKDLFNSEKRCYDLEKHCKKLEKDNCAGVSVDEVEQLRLQLSKKEAELSSKSNIISDLNRTIQKRDREIEALQKKVDDGEERIKSVSMKYAAEKDRANDLAINCSKNEVPIYSYINSIKKYHIALIGGDMLFSRVINDYGLDNIRTYKAGYRNISYEDLSDMDLVVIATAFLDHSTEDGAMNACRKHKIRCLKFNNKNVDMLIYSIFSELYK